LKKLFGEGSYPDGEPLPWKATCWLGMEILIAPNNKKTMPTTIGKRSIIPACGTLTAAIMPMSRKKNPPIACPSGVVDTTAL